MQSFAIAAALLLAGGSAAAQEAYTSWDTFGVPEIRFDRWLFGERVRVVKAQTLAMVQRDYGDQIGDTGRRSQSWGHTFDEPARITQMRALVTVNSYEATGCGANPTSSVTIARLVGDYFNTGAPTPGSQVNDVIGQIRLIRQSNSADPAGVLRVEGAIDQCTTPDCSSSISLGLVPLGTVNTGTVVKLQIEWDEPGDRFHFRKDNDAVQTLTYSVPDSAAPGVPSKSLGLRTGVANCLSGPRTAAGMDATFDYVQVNASGTP